MGAKDIEVLEKKIQEGEEKEEQARRKARREKVKKKKASFFADFKKFITRGNVLDMAVGVIVGGAFTAIINALSNNILKPVINFLLATILGEDSLSEIYTFLKRVDTVDEAGNTIPDLAQSIYIDWGAFINAIINFLLIAFTLFVIVRIINNIRKHMDADEIAAAAAKAAADAEKAKIAAAEQAEAAAQAAAAVKAREDAMFENICKQTELLAKMLEEVKK